MNLYDIHTHKIDSTQVDSCTIKSILNTFPEDFLEKKIKFPGSWFSCGIHPWYSQTSASQIERLKEIIVDPAVVGLGEIGLDKLRGPDMENQLKIFRQQLDLSIEVQKPVIIHCVKAWDELISLCKEYERKRTTWIIHGYRGSPEQTKQLSRLGLKFSIGENFNKESLKVIPLDSIFFETDTSKLSICQICQNISAVIEMRSDHFAIFVEKNVQKVFMRGAKLQ